MHIYIKLMANEYMLSNVLSGIIQLFLVLHEYKEWLGHSPPIFLPRFKFIWLIRWSTAVCSINYVLSVDPVILNPTF